MNSPLWWRLVLVGVGGALGSIARYVVGGWVQSWHPVFPVGTWVVNGAGCFVMGLLSIWTFEHGWIGHEGRLLWIVGVMGGFTTFSAFGYETMALLQQEQWGWAVVNVTASVGGGLAGVWLGWMAGRAMS